MDLKEEIKRIAEHMKTMSEEKFLTDVLCLNGIMSQELLDDVFENIIPYSSDGICFSDEELEKHKKFMEVFNYIDEFIKIKYPYKKIEVTDIFPEFESYFTYKDKFYRWSVLIGQGSYCGIYELEESDNSFKLTLDTSLRYYKRKE